MSPPMRRISSISAAAPARFTQALADRFAARVTAIDPSQKMLDQARKQVSSPRVAFTQAPGEALPLADGSADVVFMSMVLHHFADMEAVAAECRRVLRAGGHVCIRSSTRETHFVHEEFFAGFRPLVDQVLPPRGRVTSVFEAAGLQPVVQQLVPAVLAPDWATFADKIALRGDSIIVRLADSDFEAGMAKLRQRARQGASATHRRGPRLVRVPQVAVSARSPSAVERQRPAQLLVPGREAAVALLGIAVDQRPRVHRMAHAAHLVLDL